MATKNNVRNKDNGKNGKTATGNRLAENWVTGKFDKKNERAGRKKGQQKIYVRNNDKRKKTTTGKMGNK